MSLKPNIGKDNTTAFLNDRLITDLVQNASKSLNLMPMH